MMGRRVVALVWACVLPAAAHAQTAGLEDGARRPSTGVNFFTGARYSSNATRAADGDSGTFLLAGAGFDVQRATSRLHATLNGAAAYEDTSASQQNGGFVGALNGTLRYALVPDRFQWVVTDTFGQTLRNTLGASTIDNRTNTNFVATGPDVDVPFGGSSGLSLSGRYARFDAGGPVGGVASGDERTVSGSGGLYHRLSRGAEVGAYASVSRVEAPGFGRQDYDQRSAYLRLRTQRSRYSLSLDGGVTEVDLLGSTERAPLVHLDFYRQLTSRLTVNLSGGQEFRSAGERFRDVLNRTQLANGAVVPLIPAGDGAVVSPGAADVTSEGAVRTRYARASLGYSRTRTEFRVDASATRERASFAPSALTDRDAWSGSFAIVRRLRTNLTCTVGAGIERRDFTAATEADRTVSGDFSLGWEITRRLHGTLHYRYEKRTTDVAALGYQEHSVYAGVSWGTGGASGTTR